MQYNRPIVRDSVCRRFHYPSTFSSFSYSFPFVFLLLLLLIPPFFWIFVFLFFANGRAGWLELTFKCHWCSSRPKDCCAGCAGGCWRPCPSRRSCQPCVPCWPAARLSLCAPFAGNEAILSSQFRPLIGWKTQSKELSETLSLISWLSLLAGRPPSRAGRKENRAETTLKFTWFVSTTRPPSLVRRRMLCSPLKVVSSELISSTWSIKTSSGFELEDS